MTALIFLLITFVNLDYPFIEIISYFTVILAAFVRLLPSANKIILSLMNLAFYKPSLNILFDEIIINKSYLNKNLSKLKKKNFLFKEKIEIKNIDFSYKDKDRLVEVFKNASMTIDRGDMIGIVGETGSGKSTLIDLILGLVEPSKGEILVDNQKIFQNKKDWNNLIGYVPQSVFLNDESLADNIYFYQLAEERNKEKLFNSIKQAQLIKFVENLPKGIDTLIGEQGQRLSGGQRQRIGIARSIYKDAEILIFDESTNSLDKITEKSFLDDITNFKNIKTIIMISHKISTLDNCNKIFEIKDSNIIQIK
jgi:ABC-type bacteriocin/lantibiotic exporter with double-glycine peptidase domain